MIRTKGEAGHRRHRQRGHAHALRLRRHPPPAVAARATSSTPRRRSCARRTTSSSGSPRTAACRSSPSPPAASRRRPTRPSACSSAPTASSSARGSSSPATRPSARSAIVEATTHYNDAEILARVSRGLGEAMVGISTQSLDPRSCSRPAAGKRAPSRSRQSLGRPGQLPASMRSMLRSGHFEHADARRLGVSVRSKPEQLGGLDGLVVPGGESTTFMRLMRLYGLDEAVRALRAARARHVRRDDRPRPRRTSALVDVVVEPQRLRPPGARASRPISSSRATSEPLRGVFIRAPRVARGGAGGRGARRARRRAGRSCARAASSSRRSIPS